MRYHLLKCFSIELLPRLDLEVIFIEEIGPALGEFVTPALDVTTYQLSVLTINPMSRPRNQLSKINDRSDKLSAKDGGIKFPRPFTELLGLKDKKYRSQDPIRANSLVLLQDPCL